MQYAQQWTKGEPPPDLYHKNSMDHCYGSRLDERGDQKEQLVCDSNCARHVYKITVHLCVLNMQYKDRSDNIWGAWV